MLFRRLHTIYRGSDNTFVVNGLIEQTDYGFRVCAINSEGSGPFTTQYFKTKIQSPAAMKSELYSIVEVTFLPVSVLLVVFELLSMKRCCCFYPSYFCSQFTFFGAESSVPAYALCSAPRLAPCTVTSCSITVVRVQTVHSVHTIQCTGVMQKILQTTIFIEPRHFFTLRLR